MPITGRTPKECFKRFRDHVAELAAAAICGTAHVAAVVKDDRATIGFFRGSEAIAVPLDGDAAGLFLALGQNVTAAHQGREVAAGERYRLSTSLYWYRLQTTAELKDNALLRWEYDPPVQGKHHARHHIQLETYAQAGPRALDLSKLHVPTGWVPMEEVCRFVINDLGHKPPCGRDWQARLREGERLFFEEFTTQRHKV